MYKEGTRLSLYAELEYLKVAIQYCSRYTSPSVSDSHVSVHDKRLLGCCHRVHCAQSMCLKVDVDVDIKANERRLCV